MSFDAHAYAIQTRRVTVEGETYYKATVDELPHLATYEDTAQEAYDVLIDDIKSLHASALEMGHQFPPPSEESEHSGRVTVRLPKSLHRTLDRQATNEGVSLNSHLIMLLTEGATGKGIEKTVSDSLRLLARSAMTTALLAQSNEGVVAPTASYSGLTHIQVGKSEQIWTT